MVLTSWNRWTQNAPQGGPAPQFQASSATNQLVGFAYDAAGNLMNDGIHQYRYDADGNVILVDGGAGGTNTYDAYNYRVRTQVGAKVTEYAFNGSGAKLSMWDDVRLGPLAGYSDWGGGWSDPRVHGARTYRRSAYGRGVGRC